MTCRGLTGLQLNEGSERTRVQPQSPRLDSRALDRLKNKDDYDARTNRNWR